MELVRLQKTHLPKFKHISKQTVKKRQKRLIKHKSIKYPPKKKSSTAVQALPNLAERLSKRFKTIVKKPDNSKIRYSEKKPAYKHQSKASIVTASSRFPFSWYIDIIQGKISSLWNEPKTVIEKRCSCVISFTILKNGSVKGIETKRSSGLDNFDRSAEQAIELAQPMPPLPPEYKHNQLTVNVEFALER